ncbi:hypothetical protein HZH66_006986 [Vespula vulgaris]|uniref:Uncharacterized protein n=1 Tax=Vespula vulgaris TaxID=7454 RepID=A0A834N5V3_VESVU|nr:hypothetical protein HZH66_006986 [Vespula vulgaris]
MYTALLLLLLCRIPFHAAGAAAGAAAAAASAGAAITASASTFQETKMLDSLAPRNKKKWNRVYNSVTNLMAYAKGSYSETQNHQIYLVGRMPIDFSSMPESKRRGAYTKNLKEHLETG